MVAALPLVLFPFCVIAAALSDIRSFKIPNGLSVALIAGFAVAALVTGMDMAALGNHALTAAAVLVIGFVLFCLNIFGAGDVKILTAIALWFGWPSFLPCLIYIGLAGGILSAAIIAARQFARFFPGLSAWFRPLAVLAAAKKLKAPYGVAICIGTLLTFDRSPLFEALFARLH